MLPMRNFKKQTKHSHIAVSVIIPVFNKSSSIKNCIQSVLAQEYTELFEVIVIDDHSSDNSWEIIQSISCHKILKLRNKKNYGPSYCRNQGIEHAKGEYIFFLDADGVAHKDFIKNGMDSLSKPHCVGVEGKCIDHTNRNHLLDKHHINPFYNLLELKTADKIHRDYPACNSAFKKSFLKKIGGYNTRRYPNGREDTDLAFRIKKYGTIAYNPNMIGEFYKEKWNLKELIKNSKRYYYDVVFLKDYGTFKFNTGKILHPKFLTFLFFPFRIKKEYAQSSLKDMIYFYIYLIFIRYYIWKAALKERIAIL